MTTALERARRRWGSAMLIKQTGPTAADDNAQLLGLQETLHQGGFTLGHVTSPVTAGVFIPAGTEVHIELHSPDWTAHPDLGGGS